MPQRSFNELNAISSSSNISFAVLGAEESCRGDPAKRSGNEFIFQIQALQNINSLNNYNEFSNLTIDYGASILEDYSIFETLSKTDSLNIKLSRLMYSRSYPEINTTFNELKSTGQFNLFKEKFRLLDFFAVFMIVMTLLKKNRTC